MNVKQGKMAIKIFDLVNNFFSWVASLLLDEKVNFKPWFWCSVSGLNDLFSLQCSQLLLFWCMIQCGFTAQQINVICWCVDHNVSSLNRKQLAGKSSLFHSMLFTMLNNLIWLNTCTTWYACFLKCQLMLIHWLFFKYCFHHRKKKSWDKMCTCIETEQVSIKYQMLYYVMDYILSLNCDYFKFCKA